MSKRSSSMTASLLCPLAVVLLGSLSASAGTAPDPESVETASHPAVATPAALADEDECDPLFDDCEGETVSDASFPDPFEGVNRGTLSFNKAADVVLLDPLTRLYAFVFPTSVKLAVRRVFANLDAPGVAINDGLQLEWVDMGVTLTRFAINSTVGIAGLFDPGAALGLEGHRSDFGQTLALAGVESGPYLVLPLLGPSTARDGAGALVDVAMSPLLYLLGPLSFEQLWRAGSSGIALREANLRGLDALEASSIDFYAAMRSAFYQTRQAQIWARRQHRRPLSWRAEEEAALLPLGSEGASSGR